MGFFNYLYKTFAYKFHTQTIVYIVNFGVFIHLVGVFMFFILYSLFIYFFLFLESAGGGGGEVSLLQAKVVFYDQNHQLTTFFVSISLKQF